MARSNKLILLFTLILSFIFICNESNAQTRGYEILPAPDIWYNDVDGIRLGVVLQGQVPGTFEDGPHRLDAGLWVSTWLPSTPLSYYASLTEPISAWSDYGSEANVQFISSIRTGYHNHGIALNKRWQQDFDERRYIEIGAYNSFEKRFDSEYVPFENIWSDQNKLLTSFSFEMQDDHNLGWYNIQFGANFQYLDDFFSVFTLNATQRTDFNDFWGIRLRAFAGAASEQTAPEYLFSRSVRPAMQWMGNGFTRAKGTIPQRWMDSGNFQVAGGANLRGYTGQDIATFQECNTGPDAGLCINNPNLYKGFASISAELDYWNPIAVLFNDIPYASDFLRFRSYLFFDSGTSLGLGKNASKPLIIDEPASAITDNDDPGTLYSNAGAGFSLSLNIPDYQGKPRGFVFRYEIPFWLSHPTNEDSFKFRHLFGFGAVISF